jgi:hypothetical protein
LRVQGYGEEEWEEGESFHEGKAFQNAANDAFDQPWALSLKTHTSGSSNPAAYSSWQSLLASAANSPVN